VQESRQEAAVETVKVGFQLPVLLENAGNTLKSFPRREITQAGVPMAKSGKLPGGSSDGVDGEERQTLRREFRWR